MQKLAVWFALAACSTPAEDRAASGSAAAPVAAPVVTTPTTPPPPPPPPAVADDPWQEGQLAPEAPPDPWAKAPPPEAAPARPPPAQRSAPAAPAAPARGTSSLAGSYQCQQLRHGMSINGMNQSAYVASAIGSFEIAHDGTYRSSSYASKGAGNATAADPTTVRFSGGAYANAIGQSGTTEMGFYIRFAGNLTDAPAATMKWNDHMCYRK